MWGNSSSLNHTQSATADSTGARAPPPKPPLPPPFLPRRLRSRWNPLIRLRVALQRLSAPPREDAKYVRHEPRLPDEMFFEIARHVTSLGEVLNLSLLCKGIRWNVLPVLYDSVCLATSFQCAEMLNAFERTPELAGYVKALTVRPNSQDWAAPAEAEALNESWMAAMIGKIASAGHFAALHTFIWEGVSVPEDSLWLTLRVSCLGLRNIGCNTRSYDTRIAKDSHMFSFSDLEGFSLRFAHHFSIPQDASSCLWDMILTRCPNLQTLGLGGPGFSDIQNVTLGRWDKLHTLRLSYVGESRAFAELLTAHPALRVLEAALGFRLDLSIHRDIGSLPGLDSLIIGGWFHGFNEYTLASFRTVKHLDLSQDLSAFRPGRLKRTCIALRGLVFLESLCTRFGPPSNNISAFQEILHACPRLTCFELRASSQFSMAPLSEALKQAERLTSVVISKVLSIWDRNMHQNAARLFRDNRGLRKLVLRQGHAPKHILGAPLLTHEYTYAVIPGLCELQEEMNVVETCYKNGARVVRKYRRDRFH